MASLTCLSSLPLTRPALWSALWQLTTEGLPRVDDVVRRVYEFIALLTRTLAEAPEKAVRWAGDGHATTPAARWHTHWLMLDLVCSWCGQVDMWHDIKLMHEINFRFREKVRVGR